MDANFSLWGTKPISRTELVKKIEKGGTVFIPDSDTQYSNSNYALLSFILEDIYNKSFAEILQAGILTPLNLVDTSFGKPKTKSSSRSYTYVKKWTSILESDPSALMGAGGIESTANDLNEFFYALFAGELVSKNSLEQMKKAKNGVGKGLFIIPFMQKIGYGHTGGIDGFRAVSVFFPEDKIAYSLTSNASNYVINDISIVALQAANNIPFEIPNFNLIDDVTSEDLDKYLGVYASKQLPIKLTITKQGNVLIGQGTGQAAFKMTPKEKHSFMFAAAGIILEFEPEKGTMILKQGGGSYLMTKE